MALYFTTLLYWFPSSPEGLRFRDAKARANLYQSIVRFTPYFLDPLPTPQKLVVVLFGEC